MDHCFALLISALFCYHAADFKAERNTLPRGAYPELQKFCAEYGLDFQVVDMRWGVTDELMNDHLVSELCLREIDTCKKVSCGPNFVVRLLRFCPGFIICNFTQFHFAMIECYFTVLN